MLKIDIKKINKSYSQLSKEEKEYIVSLYYERKDLKYAELQSLLGVSQRVLSTVMKEYNINSRLKNRYTLNERYFSVISTEEQAYILGYICADGYVGNSEYNNIVIQSKDSEVVSAIAQAIEYTGEIRKAGKGGYSNSQEGYTLNFSNAIIANDLRNLGILPNKSLNFNQLLDIPQHLQRHFLRGYFDGDGCIVHTVQKSRYKDKIYEYDSLTMIIIATTLFIQDIIQHFEIKQYSIQKSKTSGMEYLRVQSKCEIKRLYYLMYHEATIFLSRKKNIWDQYIECL